MDDQPRRTADYLRSTADLTEYFRSCREMGDLQLAESALRDMPEWATFHEVRSALGAAGLQLCIRPLSVEDKRAGTHIERRKGPRKH